MTTPDTIRRLTGQQLREARLAVGLRQLDLARAVGVTRSAVSRWERGADVPDDHRWPLILAAIGEQTASHLPSRSAND